VLAAGDVELDPARREVRRKGHAIELTGREYAVLEYLMRNPNHVLSRDQIAEHVWGFDFDATSNVIDVYVAMLRRKLGDNHEPQLLHTVRGVGYQLRVS
jgi:DNA-binding response OmpR family regulator